MPLLKGQHERTGRNTLQPWVNNSQTLNLIVCRKRQQNPGRISLLKRKAQHKRKRIQRRKHGKVKTQRARFTTPGFFLPRESPALDSRCGSSVHTFPIQLRFIVSYLLATLLSTKTKLRRGIRIRCCTGNQVSLTANGEGSCEVAVVQFTGASFTYYRWFMI